MNEENKLNLGGGLQVYPEDTKESAAYNKSNALLHFCETGHKLTDDVWKVLNKHNAYDEKLYKELCKYIEGFCGYWGTIVAGRVAEQVIESLEFVESKQSEGPLL